MYLSIAYKKNEATIKCTCTERVAECIIDDYHLIVGNALELQKDGMNIKASRFSSIENAPITESKLMKIIAVLDESYNIQQPQYLPVGEFENGDVKVLVKNGAQGFVPRYLASHNEKETFVYAENTGAKTKFPEVVMPFKKTQISSFMEWSL